MEKDVIAISSPDVINSHGRKSAADALIAHQTNNEAGFFGQVFGNPFFTAVGYNS